MSKKNSFAGAVGKQLLAEGRVSVASSLADTLDEGSEHNKGSSLFLSAAGLIVNACGHKELGKLMGKTASRLREKK